MIVAERSVSFKRVNLNDPRDIGNAATLAADILNAGGLISTTWGTSQRRIFVLMGVADDKVVALRANRLKGRPVDQPLSISVIPEVVREVIVPDSSPALMRAAERFRMQPADILGSILRRMPMGFHLEAQPHLGDWVTSIDEQGRKVVYIGGGDTDDRNNLYARTYEVLWRKYHRIAFATSANPTGKDTFPVTEHTEWKETLQDGIDLLLMEDTPLVHPIPYLRHMVSPTIVRLLKDPVELVRRGSKHERVLEPIFGKITVPQGVTVYKFPEREWEALITILGMRLNRALAGLRKAA